MTFRLLPFLLLIPSLLHAGGWERVSTHSWPTANPDVSREVVTARETATGREVTVEMATFDPARVSLLVVDAGSPPAKNLQTAMKASGCVAGVNGGYFHPDFKPVGLMISEGKTISPFITAKLLSGLVVRTKDRLSILRREQYKAGPMLDALQAGPFLVDDGAAVTGLNAERVAARTIVLTDGAKHFAIGTISGVTLQQAGDLLSSASVATDWKIVRALNLDGGSSTGFWIRELDGHELYRPEFKPVRNFVGLKPRS